MEKIADFVDFNASQLEEMKKNAPELYNAVQSVVAELSKKYGTVTAKKAAGAEPKKPVKKYDEEFPFDGYDATTTVMFDNKDIYNRKLLDEFYEDTAASTGTAGIDKITETACYNISMRIADLIDNNVVPIVLSDDTAPGKVGMYGFNKLPPENDWTRLAFIFGKVALNYKKDKTIFHIKTKKGSEYTKNIYNLVEVKLFTPFRKYPKQKDLQVDPLQSSAYSMFFTWDTVQSNRAANDDIIVGSMDDLVRFFTKGTYYAVPGPTQLYKRISNNEYNVSEKSYIGNMPQILSLHNMQSETGTIETYNDNGTDKYYIEMSDGKTGYQTESENETRKLAKLFNIHFKSKSTRKKPEPTPKSTPKPRQGGFKELDRCLLDYVSINGTDVGTAYVLPGKEKLADGSYTVPIMAIDTDGITNPKVNLTTDDIIRLLDGETTKDSDPQFTLVACPGRANPLYMDNPIVLPMNKYPQAVGNDGKRKGPTQSAGAYATLCRQAVNMPDDLIYKSIQGGETKIPFVMYGNDGTWYYLTVSKNGTASWKQLTPNTYEAIGKVLMDHVELAKAKTSSMTKEQLLKEKEELIETLSYFDKTDPEYKETQTELAAVEEQLKNIN